MKFLGTNLTKYTKDLASQVMLVVKNLPANAGDIRDPGSVPGLERSPGGGHGNPLQHSSLENPLDRGVWWLQSTEWQSQTRLKRQHSTQISLLYSNCKTCLETVNKLLTQIYNVFMVWKTQYCYTANFSPSRSTDSVKYWSRFQQAYSRI